jgi:DNA-binding response OmpR family regulator
VQPRILIIDDDERLAEMLQSYLGARGLVLEQRADARSGLAALRKGGYDALILDVMLPDMDGFEVCRAVRAIPLSLPILMLTGRGDELDRIVGLELGADDYLPKPFNPRELLARLRAVLRRTAAPVPAADDVLRFGPLEIDRARREVRLHGQPRPLTSHQFALLLVLAERKGRVLSREQLMEAVRGQQLELYDRSIDVHISRIRAAIEDEPGKPRRIKTVRAAGYVFTAAQDE